MCRRPLELAVVLLLGAALAVCAATPAQAALVALSDVQASEIVGAGGSSHHLDDYYCKGPNYPASDCTIGCYGPVEWEPGIEVWIKCADPHGFRYCQPDGPGCTYWDWLICSPTVNVYLPPEGWGGSPCRSDSLDDEKSPTGLWKCAKWDACAVAPY
ncbi:MAG: hypothetical protein ACE149_05530 [Armatimonadota bacterium]